MSEKRAPDGQGLRFEADEPAPAALAFGLGLQLAVLTVTVPIVIPTAVMRIGGAGDAYLAWAVFAAVAISGIATALQAFRFGRIGGGLMLVMGSSAAFIGVSITAVEKGGPAMLATLVVIGALFQILLSARLAAFRKFLTPAVSGTVIMLIPVTVMPILFRMLDDVPEGSPDHAAPSIALVTVLAILGVSLKGTPSSGCGRRSSASSPVRRRRHSSDSTTWTVSPRHPGSGCRAPKCRAWIWTSDPSSGPCFRRFC